MSEQEVQPYTYEAWSDDESHVLFTFESTSGFGKGDRLVHEGELYKITRVTGYTNIPDFFELNVKVTKR